MPRWLRRLNAPQPASVHHNPTGVYARKGNPDMGMDSQVFLGLVMVLTALFILVVILALMVMNRRKDYVRGKVAVSPALVALENQVSSELSARSRSTGNESLELLNRLEGRETDKHIRHAVQLARSSIGNGDQRRIAEAVQALGAAEAGASPETTALLALAQADLLCVIDNRPGAVDIYRRALPLLTASAPEYAPFAQLRLSSLLVDNPMNASEAAQLLAVTVSLKGIIWVGQYGGPKSLRQAMTALPPPSDGWLAVLPPVANGTLSLLAAETLGSVTPTLLHGVREWHVPVDTDVAIIVAHESWNYWRVWAGLETSGQLELVAKKSLGCGTRYTCEFTVGEGHFVLRADFGEPLRAAFGDTAYSLECHGRSCEVCYAHN